jgi:UDP-N-acetylmuramoyl-L-alanyl-D-glutamate--2,6-diaminopimelate ligase
MALKEIMSGLELHSPLPDLTIHGLTHDSRQVAPGSLFVALPGLHDQGTAYIAEAAGKGASALAGPPPEVSVGNLPYLVVDNPPLAYSRMAANYFSHPSHQLSVIGITGTNGKTTTAELMTAILNAHGTPTATIGTLGLHRQQERESIGFTTPEANQIHRILAELLDHDIQAVVMEVSSHALKQYRVDDVDFNAVVFTNFTQDHLDYHPDMEDYLASKLHLFDLIPPDRPAVVNLDDPHAEFFLRATPGPVLTYSLNQGSDLRVKDMGLSLEVTVANLIYHDQSFSIESALVGQYNLENILAAAATSLALGLPPETIQAGLARVTSVPGRLERIPSAAPGKVFIDYAHTPDAYAKLLSTVRDLSARDTEIITLFGCGGDRDRTKRPLMAAQAELYSDQIVITSDNPRTESLEQINADILQGFSRDNHVVIENRQEALLHCLRSTSEKSILMILGKGREDYEIIGTEKVYHNDVEIVGTYEP